MAFPDFMLRPENRIPASQQNTPDIEGYYYTAEDGSQMAFWTYKADRVSKEHIHAYDEWMIVVEGEYLVTIDGSEHLLHAGDELFIPAGSIQGGRVKKGTRSIHAFGGQRVSPFDITVFTEDMQDDVTGFLADVYEENGKVFDIGGRHRIYADIGNNFELFLCIRRKDDIVGTAALKRLSDTDCELKAMYIYRQYQGNGLGLSAAKRIICEAKNRGFRRIYLDSMQSHSRALKLYRSLGFRETERYNDNEKADIFMVLDLQGG